MLLILALPLLLLGGMAITAQSAINGTLSMRTDVVTSAWLTNVILIMPLQFGNTQIVLDYKRIAAIALLACALYLIYLSDVWRVVL